MLVNVRNATDLPRNGVVCVPWSELRRELDIHPDSLVTVKYGERQLTRVQIDKIHYTDDPDDTSLWELSVYVDFMSPGGFHEGTPFHLDVDVIPGVTVQPPKPREEPPWVRPGDHKTDVKMASDQLEIFLQLLAGTEPHDYWGGAINSVVLSGREILDAFKAEENPSHDHDPYKRLQLDRVALPNEPWAENPATEIKLYQRDWRYVTHGEGPVRAWVVIESPEINYPDERSPKFTGHLYRVISLHHDADYIVEEMFVAGSAASEPMTRRFVAFAPHYFLKMNFDERPIMQINRVADIPDWFTITSERVPLQAYGFAATDPCNRIDNPPHDYPAIDDKHSAFGWTLGFAKKVRAMHLFKRGLPHHEAAADTGRKWFDLILKAPTVMLHEEPQEKPEEKEEAQPASGDAA